MGGGNPCCQQRGSLLGSIVDALRTRLPRAKCHRIRRRLVLLFERAFSIAREHARRVPGVFRSVFRRHNIRIPRPRSVAPSSASASRVDRQRRRPESIRQKEQRQPEWGSQPQRFRTRYTSPSQPSRSISSLAPVGVSTEKSFHKIYELLFGSRRSQSAGYGAREPRLHHTSIVFPTTSACYDSGSALPIFHHAAEGVSDRCADAGTERSASPTNYPGGAKPARHCSCVEPPSRLLVCR
jgi:hypothetical protein